MCGIAGILQPNPRNYSLNDLQRMTESIAHRGPDGHDHWRSNDGTVLLGHRRLKILDLSDQAKQPLHYSGRYTLVHNGEIYNYLEIKKTLSQKGYQFHSSGDTEIIAAAYDHWGADCLSHFDGMFAFALWDEKEQTLFAARDRFGEKPFYYTLQGETLIFASEIKAFHSLGLACEIDRNMAFHYLTLGYVDDPLQPDRSFFHEIHKLPPAHRLSYSAIYQTARIERYWDIDLASKQSDPSEKKIRTDFLSLLETSVRRRLRSDVPIGCTLSGGLDSSSLACLISQQLKEPLETFTAIFPGFEQDEAVAAQTISNRIGGHHHTISLSDTDWFSAGMECLQQQDEPVQSSSVFAQYAVYRAVARSGSKVVIDGQGADETLAGYERYLPWYWQGLYRKGLLNSSRERIYATEQGLDIPFGWKNKLAAFLPDLAAHQRRREYKQKARNDRELDRHFVLDNVDLFHHSLPEHPDLNGALYFSTCTHGLEELLRYADRNAMRFGLELRLPFLSHELVEFIFSLPDDHKIRHGWRKWILRRSMDDRLPASVCWNPKKVGFETPQIQWMQQHEFQEGIQQARKKLIQEKMLSKTVAQLPIRPRSAYSPDPKDWRYFSLAQLFA